MATVAGVAKGGLQHSGPDVLVRQQARPEGSTRVMAIFHMRNA